jgi:hypothetical protein
LNTRFKTAELKQVLQRLQPAIYIGQAELDAAVAAVDSTILPLTARYIVGGPLDADGAQPWASLLEDSADIAMPSVPDIDSPRQPTDDIRDDRATKVCHSHASDPVGDIRCLGAVRHGEG